MSCLVSPPQVVSFDDDNDLFPLVSLTFSSSKDLGTHGREFLCGKERCRCVGVWILGCRGISMGIQYEVSQLPP